MGMKHVVTDLTTGEIIKIEDIPADVDPQEHFRQQMDDCPLCKEARARGEVPITFTAEEIRRAVADARHERRSAWRRPRWRELKRRRS